MQFEVSKRQTVVSLLNFILVVMVVLGMLCWALVFLLRLKLKLTHHMTNHFIIIIFVLQSESNAFLQHFVSGQTRTDLLVSLSSVIVNLRIS